MQPVIAVGLMSGTSLDGIDAAVIRTDGERIEAFGSFASLPYDVTMRARLRGGLRVASQLGAAASQAQEIVELTRDLTRMHGLAVKTLLAEAGLQREQVAVIGFHGQTLLHRPAERLTMQIGDGPMLARSLDIDVVYDFRSADVAAGGQGAPLVPLYHQALAHSLPQGGGRLAVLNIGGIANLTLLGPGGEILAFDMGPGNCLIDDWCLMKTGEPIDRDGALAARGKINALALAELMRTPLIAAPPPKSLDRMAFDAAPVAALSPQDGAATLAAFTAAAVAESVRHLPVAPARWIVCGGGRHNRALMAMLADRLAVPVQTAEAVGWRGDALEAEAFAFLAVRSLRGLPLSLPATTGAPWPMTGGVLAQKP